MRLIFIVFAAAAGLAACGGGGSSPTAPTGPAPAPAPTPAATPAPAPTAGPVVVRGTSISCSNGHAASGRAEIVRNGSAFTLELRSDFRIDGGNNDVYLARQTDRVTGDDLNLGNLRSRTGAQSYEMPNDGAAYPYVIIWCRPFRVPIGWGELR